LEAGTLSPDASDAADATDAADAAVPVPAPAPAMDMSSAEEDIDDGEEQTYELEVPPNTRPGHKLKLTIPGMPEKVVITVPEGAEPGRTISFTLPRGKKALDEHLEQQTKAATALQAKMRGVNVRRKATAAASSPGRGQPPRPAPTAPAITPVKSTPTRLPTKVEPLTGESSPGFLSGLRQSAMGLFTSDWNSSPSLSELEAFAPPSGPGAVAADLAAVAAGAITAWETKDFDTFAALALPSVTVSLTTGSASGMQGVWATRSAEEVEGVLSIDTVMAQLDEEGGTTATVVAIEHSHDTSSHGMPIKHAWLRMALRKVAPVGGGSSWRITELLRDPIWPPPTEEGAAPEQFRLGHGRTLGCCADAASISSVALTAWLAGDRPRFEMVVTPDVTITFNALGVRATDVAQAWEARTTMLKLGSLMTLNSPLIDTHDDGSADVLAHAHMYSVGGVESSGRPTAHFALHLRFVNSHPGGDLVLSEIVGDVVWMSEGTYETNGLALDSPPLQTIYTRALTFVKAWEVHAEDAIDMLVSDTVHLAVPRNSIEHVGKGKLLTYRASLGSVGMLTVDSVRVVGKRFECYLHEYGVDANQHGLPRMHAALKLDFRREGREMLLSSMLLDIEYTPPVRRNSTFSDVGADIVTTREL